mgnify:CR=1 FL=1
MQSRFNPFSYNILTKALDSQNLGRGRGSVESALKRISARTHVIGIKTDILFPVNEQARIAAGIQGASFKEIDSFYGHDGFLLEVETITEEVKNLIEKK